MNFIDLLVICHLVALGIRGYRRGLLLEGLEAASAVVGLWAAYHYGREPARFVSIHTGVPMEVTGPVFFVGVAVIVTAIGFAMAAVLRGLFSGHKFLVRLDGWGGLGFGMIKGGVIALVVLILLIQLPFRPLLMALDASLAGRYAQALVPELFRHLDRLTIFAP